MKVGYDYSQPFEERTRVSLANPTLGANIATAVDRQAAGRAAGVSTLEDFEQSRDLAARIRDYNLSRLDEHLERLALTWDEAGGTVFFASDAAEAREYVLNVARRIGARTAVKSKSMVSEEVELNEALTRSNVEPIETDLGQFIVQVAGEPPSHINAPAVHKSQHEITELFSGLAGENLPNDPLALAAFARDWLRTRFLSAELGISGVNFGVATEGTVCLVTNEGNGRMCTSMPRVHIALMGMERVVWDFEQLAVMRRVLARSNTGQKITQYTSLLHGPKRPDEPDGPEESHLVILDNGRSDILGTRFQAALRCIRCGACLNVCPVFRQVGGYAYDSVYSGPIGAVITPLLKGTTEAGELAHASTLCGACTDVCPVGIPLHDLLLYLRQQYADDGAGVTERAAYRAWSLAWSNPKRFRLFERTAHAAARVAGGRVGKRLPLPLLDRWTRGRDLPVSLKRAYKQEAHE